MTFKPPKSPSGATNNRNLKNRSIAVDDEQQESGGLPIKDIGNTIHICVCTPAGVHDTWRSLHERALTAVDVKTLCSVACGVSFPSELGSLFTAAQISLLTALVQLNVRESIWETCFVEKEAGLFHRRSR